VVNLHLFLADYNFLDFRTMRFSVALLLVSCSNFLMPSLEAARVAKRLDFTLGKKCPGGAASGWRSPQGKPLVCCCKVSKETSRVHPTCTGKASNNYDYRFHEATDQLAIRDKNHLSQSQTCAAKTYCCHIFEGSTCQMDGGIFATRYSNEADASVCLPPPPKIVQQKQTEPEIDPLAKDTPEFLKTLKAKPNQHVGTKLSGRDYTLIIDRSGSMNTADTVVVPDAMAKNLGKNAGSQRLSRWKQVEGALEFLAPYVAAEDPDGVSVYFFSSGFDGHDGICSANDAHKLFQSNSPTGGTYLAPVLIDAMEPDTLGRGETIFVLTDGAASDQYAVKTAIIEHTKKMCNAGMLSISFIQVGSDSGAGTYLEQLDNELHDAKFDIVDAMTKDEMHGKSFMEVIEMSLFD